MKTIFTFVLIFISSLSFAYTFNPGDVISADMMNEIFQQLDNVTAGFTSTTELEGEWSCDETNSLGGTELDCASDGNWSIDSSGLFATRNQTLTISSGMVTVSKGAPTRCGGATYANTPFSSAYAIKDGVLIWNPPYGREFVVLTKAAATLFKWQSRTTVQPVSMICRKVDVPPNDATDLSGTTSGATVSLTWADNSSSEDGFKIFRRDTLEGEWSQIGIVAPDVTAFSDTLIASGTYWYRVKSYNEYGDALGSNVLSIDAAF